MAEGVNEIRESMAEGVWGGAGFDCGRILIEYYYTPRKEEIHLKTDGYFIWDMETGQGELVSVEVKGERLNYIFHNKDDVFRGEIRINGRVLDMSDGISEIQLMFPRTKPEYASLINGDADGLLKAIYMSGDLKQIVCKVRVDSDWNLETGFVSGQEALIAIPASHSKEAAKVIDEMLSTVVNKGEWILE